jgi:hypothetical protein
MNDVILGASQDDLGGKRLARLLTRLLDKATTLAEEPTANKRLKKAGKQLRLIAMKLNKALAKDRADANVVNELTALIGEAQNIIAGLIN